jgi:hypothetical protein
MQVQRPTIFSLFSDYLFIYLFIHLFKLSTLNEFIPAPLAETNERSSATGKGTWIDLNFKRINNEKSYI